MLAFNPRHLNMPHIHNIMYFTIFSSSVQSMLDVLGMHTYHSSSSSPSFQFSSHFLLLKCVAFNPNDVVTLHFIRWGTKWKEEKDEWQWNTTIILHWEIFLNESWNLIRFYVFVAFCLLCRWACLKAVLVGFMDMFGIWILASRLHWSQNYMMLHIETM